MIPDRPKFHNLPRPETNVIDATSLFRYRSLESRIEAFYESAEKNSIQGTPVNPKDCIGYFKFDQYAYARQVVERLSSVLANGRENKELLRTHTDDDGIKRFILTPKGPIRTLDIDYSVFTPEPNVNDPRIKPVLVTLGIDPYSRYSLLTVGPPDGALVDGQTEEAMKRILEDSELSPTELRKEHAAEVTYVILTDGRIVKFITLPLAVLGTRRPLCDVTIFRRADALSAVNTFRDSPLIANTLIAFNEITYRSSQLPNP